MGRFVPKKAPLDAIRAVQHANEQDAGLTLDVIGDGPLWDEAQEYVRAEELGDTVTLHGRRSNEAVAQHMQATDAFLLPSKRPQWRP